MPEITLCRQEAEVLAYMFFVNGFWQNLQA
jgi:hypothetical protein